MKLRTAVLWDTGPGSKWVCDFIKVGLIHAAKCVLLFSVDLLS